LTGAIPGDMANKPLDNVKWETYCQEYLLDLNQTAAYKRAGYVSKSKRAVDNASRLHQRPEVKARIDFLMAQREERTQIKTDRVVTELADIGLADIRTVIKCTGRSVTIRNLDKLTAAQVACILRTMSRID
jgi:phage terminase small subunit